MPKFKKFLDVDVVTESRARMRYLADQFDHLVVSFSGGKDSLCVLELARELAAERGQQVKAVFYDEEVIPTSVIDLVKHYADQPWLDLDWYAVPMGSTRFILGNVLPYTQWDPGRPHVRPRPGWALTEKDLGIPKGTAITQYEINDIVAQRAGGGKVAILNGIRASESTVRYRSCMAKLSDNYINAGHSPKYHGCKPIFDWEQNDIFKFILEAGLAYTELYDRQALAGATTGLRVATPFIAESAQVQLPYYRQWDPVFYDQMIAVFPEMEVQERYWAEVKRPPLPRWKVTPTGTDVTVTSDTDRHHGTLTFTRTQGGDGQQRVKLHADQFVVSKVTYLVDATVRVTGPHAPISERCHLTRIGAGKVPDGAYDTAKAICEDAAALVHDPTARPAPTMAERYGMDGPAGVERFIREHISDPHQRVLARKRAATAFESQRAKPLLYQTSWILQKLMDGSYKRGILHEPPTNARRRARREGNPHLIEEDERRYG